MLLKHHSKQDHRNISFAMGPKITVQISRLKNCSAEKFHEFRDLTVFLEVRSRKTVRFPKQITSANKYPSIFSRRMDAIVYIFDRIVRVLMTFYQ